MKIDKPSDALILLSHGARFGKPCLTVTLGYMVGADGQCLNEQAAWAALMKQFKGQPFDRGEKKSRGVFAVAGAACAPQGHQVLAMTVTARCANREKILHVYGDRTWRRAAAGLGGWIPGEPQPFAVMPLDLAHAYGGPLWRDNPQGRGHAAEGADWASTPLPNLELPGSPCLTPSDRPAVASFLPQPPEVPARTQWLGAFDERWRKTRFPDYPDDTDPRFFDAVTEDQCMERYFSGNERYEVSGMHAQQHTVGGRLPGLRPRLLWRADSRAENGARLDDGAICESPLDLDTVWLLPNDERVLVLYRATWCVNQLDATDVAGLKVFTERMSDEAASTAALAARWRDEMAARAASAQAVPVPPVPPPPAPVVVPTSEELAQKAAAQLDALWASKLSQHQEMAQQLAQQPGGAGLVGLFPPPSRAAFEAALARSPKRGDPLPDVMAEMRAEMARVGMPAAQIEQLMNVKAAVRQTPAEALQEANLRVAALPLSEAQKSPLLGHLAALSQAVEASEAKLAAADEALQAARAAKAAKAAAAASAAPASSAARTPLDLAALCARLAAHQPLTRIRVEQQDLSALTFDHVDLSESEFIGCNFNGASLRRAALRRTTFTECTLQQARFDATDATGASFKACDLSAASFAGCDGSDWRWTGCTAPKLDVSGAKLERASFSESTLDGLRAAQLGGAQITLRHCTLSEADFTHANLARASFTHCQIDRACFNQAQLHKAQWQSVNGRDGQWRGANLTNWRVFSQCVLEAGDFTQANLTQACLRNSSLAGSRLCDAQLERALLLECNLTGTDGYHASARGAQFTGSQLVHAQWRGANLMAASLRKTHLLDLDLTGANLYGVDIRGAQVSGVKLYQALLTRCRLLEEHVDG
ncbi:DUF2169 family type VI secretion system accessory protein [Paraburkholderia bonniea]|uniref:DUF2169 family type VI secretion system accessory protein n=1 Tax=Paraburkholderia bonniea TaxID=2152891 RepID=UPI001290CA88|nr:DUF2169 domain-containing protein [Paraburkholderia bonniea]